VTIVVSTEGDEEAIMQDVDPIVVEEVTEKSPRRRIFST
jgi:hypothetical protein